MNLWAYVCKEGLLKRTGLPGFARGCVRRVPCILDSQFERWQSKYTSLLKDRERTVANNLPTNLSTVQRAQLSFAAG